MAEWLTSSYGRQIDNVRLALDWAFSPAGDASIGVRLTVAAIPLWFQLPLIDDCFSPRAAGAHERRPGAEPRRACAPRVAALGCRGGMAAGHQAMEITAALTSTIGTFSFERASFGADRGKGSQCSIIAASIQRR